MKLLLVLKILISILLIQGCAATAIVGTAAGVKAITDPRTVGTQVDDNTLELRINNALSKNEQLKKKTRINVVVYQGKVLLVGQSPGPWLSSRAAQIAMDVKGVVEVFNEIRQGNPIGFSTASSDTWITTKVRSRLLTSNQTRSSRIKIITENSEVFLFGLVTKREGEIAADIASRVNGVKHVTTIFSYIQ